MQKHLLIFMITFIFALKSEDIYTNSWAVIIGIDKYENSEPLKYRYSGIKVIAPARNNQKDMVKSFREK